MAELRVPESTAGARLDVFLAEYAGSRAAAQKLIDGGRVTVDGVARAKRHSLAGGEKVAITDAAEPSSPAPESTATFSIAYEDDHVLVVDKPAGVVVHPGSGRAQGTLVQALAGRVAGGADETRPGVVHRLDRDTSGLLVMARSERAHAALQAQIASRSVLREYTALVDGRPPSRVGTIDAPLGRDVRVRTRMSTDTDHAREAVTHFEVQQALPRTTLLRVRLETGRTHQIRAHLKAIGHAVVGDPEYGRPRVYGLERQFLHAAHLRFEHPVSLEEVDVRSPLPADLARALSLAQADTG